MERVIKRLDSIHARVLEAIAPLAPATYNRRPQENEWSVADIINHLFLVEERVIKDLEKALAREPKRLGLLRRMVPTSVVAVRLVRVKAPKAVQPELNSERRVTVNEFNLTRQKLKELCATHGKERLRQTAFKHPFLGEITGVATVSFVAYHEQRHYKQIREVLKKLGV
jgi:uncharacterized damage-inducible protein DinB